MQFVALLSLLSPVAAVITAQSICVYNDAAFVLKWHLHDKDHNKDSADTPNYPVWQTKCMSALAAGSDMAAGTALVPAVKAFWGKSLTPPEQVLYDNANATQITYVCRGTTLDYSCKQEAPPPTAADVVKDTGEFLLGFTEGLGAEVGFAKCLADVNATYRDIVAVVDFFESGVNHKSLPAIVKAFELIGGLLKDFGDAITACVAEAKDLAAKLKTLASALSGNVLSIIKVVIDDIVHVYHERTEISDDCKSTATHWRAGDFKGAGSAVGDIVGIILGGLEAAALQAVEA